MYIRRHYMRLTRKVIKMLKKLKKTGNSHALNFDKSLMELMDITPETPLELELNGRTLTVRPADPSKVAEAADRLSKRYHRAMKRLAK